MIVAFTQRASPLGGEKCCLDSVYIYIPRNTHAYIRCNIDVYIRCPYNRRILGALLLLLLATTVIASLFWEFQPHSNNAVGSVVVPKTALLFLTTVLKHKYVLKVR